MKRYLLYTLPLSVFSVALWIFSSGCNQKMPDTANTLLSDTITLHGFKTSSTAVETAYRRFAQFNDGSMFLGKFGAIEAVSCTRFPGIPDSLGSITEADIESATLSLQPLRYALGDTTQNRLKINIVELLKPYSDTTKADQITPDYFDSKIIASIDAQIPLQDTIAPIAVPFDKSIVVKWLQRKQQFKNDTLTWGIAFRDNGSTAIRRFATPTVAEPDVSQTTLRIIYRQAGGTLDTMTWKSGNDATFTYAPLGEAGSITVHGSVAVDGIMHFDVSALPAGSAVHLAKLTLTLDPSRSIVGNFGADSVIGARFIDSSNSKNLAHDYFGYRIQGSQKYVFPLLNSAVDGMLRRSGKGIIVLRPESKFDMHQCNRLVFFGHEAADSTVRPMLEAIYSTRPKMQP